MRHVVKKLANSLLSMYTHTHKGLDYEKQRKALVVLNCLCHHPTTRKYLLENKFFKKH